MNIIRRIALVAAAGLAAICTSPAGAETYLGSIPITENAGGMAMDAVRNRIWMQANNTLAVVDAASGAATYFSDPLVLTPSGIAINPVTNKVYVSRSAAGTVVEVDGATHAVTLLATTASPYGIAVNAATNHIYVGNHGAGTVTVINGSTRATSTVAVGANPTSIEVDTIANRIYVANSAGASVTMIDGISLATTTIPIGSNPGQIAVDASANRIYVINGANGITVINGTTHATTHVATAPGPSNLAVNPLTRRIYVSNYGATPTVNGIVTIVDGSTLTTSAVAAGANCCAIAVNPVTNRIYAVGGGYFSGLGSGTPLGKLTIIDGATNATTTIGIDGGSVVVNPVTNRAYVSYSTVVSTAHLGQVHVIDGTTNTTASIATAALPGAIASNPAMGTAYVAHYDNNTVTRIEAASGNTVVFPTGANPLAVAVDAGLNRIYVANQGSDSVTVLNGALPGTTTVAVGDNPTAIEVNPVTHKVYVANKIGNSVSVIDAATLAVTTIPVGTHPVALAIDPVRDRIYVACENAGAITIIDGATNTTTSVPTALYTAAIAVNPRTGKAYAMSLVGNSVTVIDGALVSEIRVRDTGGVIAINPVTNTIYLTNSDAKVTVIDGATGAVRFVPLAGVPTAMAISVARDQVYVATSVNAVEVFAGNATAVAGSIPVQTGSHQIAVDPVSHYVFVANTGSGTVSVITPAPSQTSTLSAAIVPLAGNRTTSPTPSLEVAVSNSAGSSTLGVMYQVDSMVGPWLRASGSGPSFQASLPAMRSGTHVLYAYAFDASVASLQGSPFVGRMAAYLFTVAQDCSTSTCIDLRVTQAAANNASEGKDLVLQLTATNFGPGTATNVVLEDHLPDGSDYVWASPPCAPASGRVTCNLGSVAAGGSVSLKIVVRPAESGTTRNTATLTAAELDPSPGDNSSILPVVVSATPAGIAVLRYRLYSPVTLEHHFTTDLNEYTVLGGNGNWVAEGTVGKVLNNPGAFNDVDAVPYYRLYHAPSQWHHWTTDANEYYTLIQFPGWNAEGVDGYIFLTQPPGTIPLYRLLYPFVPGLHHWTIDPNEYSALVTSYGWIGEGGSGFVIQ